MPKPLSRSLTAAALALAAGATLLAGCGAPASSLGAPGAPSAFEASAAGGKAAVGTYLKGRFKAAFKSFDANGDSKWTAADVKLPEDRFLNLFGPLDTNDDHQVTFAEFYPDAKHRDRLDFIMARAGVTSQALGGRVGFDEAFMALEVYLQPYLNKADRKAAVKKAFATSDKNDDGILSKAEFPYAYAILEGEAEQKDFERRINRSLGQPER